MVVGANDLGAFAPDGFAGDASQVIPAEGDGLIPEDADTAAPSEWVDDDAAASDVTGIPVDEDPQAAIRAEVESALRSEIETTFNERFRQFQATKDREVAEWRNRSSQVDAYNQALLQHYVQRMTEAGVEQGEIERDIDAVMGRAQRHQQQQAQTVQTAEQRFRSWAVESGQRMQAEMNKVATGPNGERLFDPTADPDIKAATQKYFATRRQYELTGDERYAQAFSQAYREHYALLHSKREAALIAPKRAQQNAAAQRQKQARAVQQQRGPQNTLNATGAAPLSDRQIKAAAEAEAVAEGLDPIKNQNEIFVRYLMKKRQLAGD